MRREYGPCRGDPAHLRSRRDQLRRDTRQGNDVGTQYRSAIFPHDAEQEAAVRRGIERAQADWDKPIVTTIEPLSQWYPAEDYHQDYWEGEGQRNPYCLAVIPPKLRKLRKSFANRLKEQAAAV
jgi:peptide-methionine (S)-S-oxide reductase